MGPSWVLITIHSPSSQKLAHKAICGCGQLVCVLADSVCIYHALDASDTARRGPLILLWRLQISKPPVARHQAAYTFVLYGTCSARTARQCYRTSLRCERNMIPPLQVPHATAVAVDGNHPPPHRYRHRQLPSASPSQPPPACLSPWIRRQVRPNRWWRPASQ